MRNPSIIFLLLLITSSSFSQITINLPLSRSVFQRDNNNASIIYISGNYDDDVLEKIEARLVPIKQGQGTTTDWAILTDKPERGSFVGTLTGTGGWYELQVRGWKNGMVVAENNVDKVGIGEVFLIAGQSNAEGKQNFGEKASTDDRVNCFNYQKIDYLDEIPPYNSFSHLDAKSSIAPRGQGTWCWGELGDFLANRLNVPIMFFNAAYQGSSIENWYSSSNLLSTIHPFYKYTYPRDTPYSYMRITLQYYLSQLGLRSVLWCQGEAELDLKTTEDYYAVALKKLIEKSRFDSGKKISWVISRTSLTNVNQTYPAVINAQNSLINPSENIFEGPYTDSIQVPRAEGVHFQNISADNAGISDLAKAWNQKLNDVFFNQSVPFLPTPILSLKTSCASFDMVTLSLPTNYSSQKWSNNATQSSIIAQNGKFSCLARDARGNYFFTSLIDLERVFPTKIPSVFAKNNPSFCEGASVDIIAESPDYASFLWNTGEVKKQITVKNSGRYAVRGIDASGCGTLESNAINTQIVPLPAKPSISFNTANISCEGTPITLTSSSTNENIWSTNENARSITLTQTGEYTITVKIIDQNGCISPFSDPAKLTIKARPETPEITQVGTYTLQAKQKNFLPGITFEWKKDASILTNKTSLVKAAKPAFFTVLALQNYTISNTQTLTCRSNLSGAFSFIPDITIKNIIIYPNPSPDGLVTIEAQEDLNGLALIVYSLKGQIIYSTAIPSLTERRLVDLSFLSEGKYIVKLISNSFEEVKQIWIEKK
jgi:hypothetical protein